MKKYKIVVPMKNHITEMNFGDATHSLKLQEVSGHLEGVTSDPVVLEAVKNTAIIEEVKK